MKTKVKYEKFEGENVGWFQKASTKTINRSRSPNSAVLNRITPKAMSTSAKQQVNKVDGDFLTYKDFLQDKNAKAIAMLESER